MNRERFKKAIVWLTLTFVFALPVAATITTPASAQGYHRRYGRQARHYCAGRAYCPSARYRHGYRQGYYGRPHQYYRRYRR